MFGNSGGDSQVDNRVKDLEVQLIGVQTMNTKLEQQNSVMLERMAHMEEFLEKMGLQLKPTQEMTEDQILATDEK
ncbi:MAG: hypothetical protein P1Q69_09855 [Candidatus Thorarchaeota archaeon]|nr:hypothetical protein [Candidatus Thorarchaeota archaeon]